MKKLTLVFASMMMLFSLKINAQNERIILLESFTNTSCGPCAAYNPGMDAIIADNADKVAAIKYHVSWPSNQDPMYLHNTSENNSRTNYYGVDGVPYVTIDGTHFSGSPSQVSQSVIDQLTAITSPMELALTYEASEADNTITVHVMGRVSTDIAGDLKLFVGVIEKEIHFTSAPNPSSNGERDFYSVMKKLLPNANGTALGQLAANDYFAYSFTWELENIYNFDQLDAIAWVQNKDTKEVYQACKSNTAMEPYFTNEASVTDIHNVKSINCSGTASPNFKLTNYGSATLTSAEIEMLVNGESVKNTTWSGNLASFKSEIVDLGEVNFAVEEANQMEVRINTVNGSEDEGTGNNTASLSFEGSPAIAGKTMKLTIRTDVNPQETTWQITDMATGQVVLEGGPYDTPNHKYDITFVLDETSCYDFTIYDEGGDGLTGSGLYGLRAGSSTVFNGKEFGYSESNEFSYEVLEDTDETIGTTTGIFPNPTSGLLNIVCEGEQVVAIYNMAGQRVFDGHCNGNLQIDMKAYGAGIYAVKVGNETQRVVVK